MNNLYVGLASSKIKKRTEIVTFSPDKETAEKNTKERAEKLGCESSIVIEMIEGNTKHTGEQIYNYALDELEMTDIEAQYYVQHIAVHILKVFKKDAKERYK
jgi:hypothetical protein